MFFPPLVQRQVVFLRLRPSSDLEEAVKSHQLHCASGLMNVNWFALWPLRWHCLLFRWNELCQYFSDRDSSSSLLLLLTPLSICVNIVFHIQCTSAAASDFVVSTWILMSRDSLCMCCCFAAGAECASCIHLYIYILYCALDLTWLSDSEANAALLLVIYFMHRSGGCV